MKRINIILLILLAVLAIALVAAYVFYQHTTASSECPIISFDEQILYITTDATDEELLEGVTAMDPEDGDVTDSLLVESTSNLINGNKCKVTYVAFDSKNHMSRAERTVCYTDYKAPAFEVTHPLVFRHSRTVDILNCINASDMFDGDITRKVMYSLEDSTNIDTVGEHTVELRVTNSKGDTAHLTVKVEVTSEEPNPANIQLSQYLVYVPVGTEFSPEKYFVSYSSGGAVTTNISGVKIESDVDTGVPGTYTVTYSTGYGSSQSHTRLIVVVE